MSRRDVTRKCKRNLGEVNSRSEGQEAGGQQVVEVAGAQRAASRATAVTWSARRDAAAARSRRAEPRTPLHSVRDRSSRALEILLTYSY